MAKSKVKISGVREIGEALRKSARMIESDPALFKDIGDYVVRGIVGNARLGKDPDGASFKDIGESWDKRRKRLATVNTTDDFFKPSSKKSRLSFTGQLLKSFSFSFNTKAKTLSFFFKGVRKPYRGIVKASLEGPATNAELAESVEETRPFVFLSDKMRKVLTSKVIKSLRQRLRDYKKLSRLLG